MKILVSTHHLLRYSGTETYTLTLVRSLSKLGHHITLYSKYQNPNLLEFSKIKNLILSNNLEKYSKTHFDIIHVHHNINAIEARYIFPNTPIIIQSHGIKPFLEQPPVIDLNISRYLAISQEVANNLIHHNIPRNKISFFNNIFDPTFFFSTNPLNKNIKRALAFSNYSHPNKDVVIQQTCEKLGIELDFIGGIYGEIENDKLNSKLNQYDVVFTVGRGAVETIFSGRIPFVINNDTFDGFVTSKNFPQFSNVNISGRFAPKKLTPSSLTTELSKYDPTDIETLSVLAQKQYSSTIKIQKLINIYFQAIASFKPKKLDTATIENYYKIIQTTRDYSDLLNYSKTVELEILKKSKFYKIYHLIQRIKQEWQD